MRAREGEKWSDLEDQALISLWKWVKNLGKLADTHERSMYSVKTRLLKLIRDR